MLRTFLRRTFSTFADIPVVNVKQFLAGNIIDSHCKTVSDSLHKFGCIIINDPRVISSYNEEFIDMMEKYFEKRSKIYYKNPVDSELPDCFPENGFQTGVTPEFKEKARAHEKILKSYTKGNEALTYLDPPYDAKWRYIWPIGNRTEKGLTPPKISPIDFPNWQITMDRWGTLMKEACFTVAEMCAMGLGLNSNVFTQNMKGGPHILAPTGSDLTKFNVGKVFAGFHYDFGFLTIHGKCRHPGLFIWLRTGEKKMVFVPEGCLLLQAGKQLEILTGGYIMTGFHEVIYTEAVKKSYEDCVKKNKIPWRVSSTLFSQIREDVILKPLTTFETELYPPKTAYDFMEEELKYIQLFSEDKKKIILN